MTEPDPPPTKDPAAVSLGRRGGKRGGKARAKALSAKRRAEIAKKAATARWAKEGEPSDDLFSPEETQRRFDALLTAALHTPPIRRDLTPEELASQPVIHEMTTEQMEAVAEEKAITATAARFIVLEGYNGAPLSYEMQAICRERGWMVDLRGYGLLPRLHDADVMWRRFIGMLTELHRRVHRAGAPRAISDTERDAIAQYAGPVTVVRAKEKPVRRSPKPMPPRAKSTQPEVKAATRLQAREAAEKRRQEAADLCIQVGFSPAEAAQRTGAPVHAVYEELKIRREAGDDMGLADDGRTRGHSRRMRSAKAKRNDTESGK